MFRVAAVLRQRKNSTTHPDSSIQKWGADAGHFTADFTTCRVAMVMVVKAKCVHSW
ncbi:MAG: hypothetical protein RBT42_09380 [Aquabacterium sp.]|jgi:hypothetical protein|uniref:hypothetical protein n=1 Tax=Aquabacterium sp. TaxID=1872578 RepID=UPI002A36B695|nr:hypothetical protein [Aquabacterium sp.]MDX9843955.1 hypothetical protein [Aquabacterium sp.]